MLNKLQSLFQKVLRFLLETKDLYLIRDSGLFDEAWYLSNNPDVARGTVDPLRHYLRYGGFERRDPSPKFRSGWYMDTYINAKNARINPLVHYLGHKKQEGHITCLGSAHGMKNIYYQFHKLISPKSNVIEPASYFDDEAFRVFCISIQRTGTKSVGKFFRDFEFSCASWPQAEKNDWAWSQYEGNYEAIFSSDDFRQANAFEDSPWWYPSFYKALYHRFPNSKFVLFTRDPEAWFQSMLNHSSGNVIGQTMVHCKNYKREKEYFQLSQEGKISYEESIRFYGDKTMKIVDFSEHYKEIYELHATEVVDFFRRNKPEALFVARLEDEQKWVNLGKYLGLGVPSNYSSHENSSN